MQNAFGMFIAKIRQLSQKRQDDADRIAQVDEFIDRVEQRLAADKAAEIPRPNDPRIEDVPKFFASLNIDVEQMENGKWTVRARDYGAYCVKDTPEEAILTAWRYIAQVGVARMPAIDDAAPAANTDEDDDDGSAVESDPR
jgi:hypothetical protein